MPTHVANTYRRGTVRSMHQYSSCMVNRQAMYQNGATTVCGLPHTNSTTGCHTLMASSSAPTILRPTASHSA